MAKEGLVSLRKKISNQSTKVFLNLLTGWTCIGFCQSEDEESQTKCNVICGIGRCNQPKKLKGK